MEDSNIGGEGEDGVDHDSARDGLNDDDFDKYLNELEESDADDEAEAGKNKKGEEKGGDGEEASSEGVDLDEYMNALQDE